MNFNFHTDIRKNVILMGMVLCEIINHYPFGVMWEARGIDYIMVWIHELHQKKTSHLGWYGSRRESYILRSGFRRAGIEQQSTGLLHLNGFDS